MPVSPEPGINALSLNLFTVTALPAVVPVVMYAIDPFPLKVEGPGLLADELYAVPNFARIVPVVSVPFAPSVNGEPILNDGMSVALAS